jgi:serine/threonine-protein kinase
MSEQPARRPERTPDEPLLPPLPVTLSLPGGPSGLPGGRLADQPAAAPPPRERLGRYEVRGEIGRGGMGAVLLAHDPTLGRDLALKVLLKDQAGEAAAVRRFQEEAQVGGQLQHPGLVPVYELGAGDDGRPFFAMKLVEGRTLADLLKERRGPAEGLPRLVQIFEQVCQAVGYAHARGVIHRDLKPANVMVGAFGEVQVMDWGLAKVLHAPPDRPAGEAARADAVRTERSGPGEPGSRAGSVMGTPAYMPPEQARGEVDRLDARADVFGLGAVLCEILTGRPPFTGKHAAEVLFRAGRGDLADAWARLGACGADAELAALARDCLAADARDRPADGGAVAARVQAYRAGVEERLRRAEVERAAAQARAAEERRRRRAQLALAAALLLLLTLGVGGGWYVRHQQVERQREQERAQRDLERAVERDLVEAAERQGQARWAEAWAALERAEGRLGGSGPAAVREQVADARRRLERLRADRDMAARLEEARAQLIGIRGREAADQAFRDAFARYGLEVVKGDPEAAAERIRQSAIREELVSGLYQWAVATGEEQRGEAERLARLGAAADPDPWRRRLIEATIRQDRPALLAQLSQADAATLSPSTALLVVVCYEIAGQTVQAVPLLQEARRRHPDDFLLNFALGKYSLRVVRPARPDEAVRFYTAATALRPHNAAVFFELGYALCKQLRVPEGILAYREACRLKPDSIELRDSVALALLTEGEWAEAEAVCRATLRVKPGYANAENDLAIALREQGKLAEAEAVCRDALRREPGSPRAHCTLGFVLRLQGKLEESRDEFRRGQELAAGAPGSRLPAAEWLREAERLAALDRRLPGVLAGTSEPDAAERADFAQVCALKGRYADAVRLYAGAFRADAKVADDLAKGRRLDAARSAVRAAAGAGEGAPPDEAERACLRGAALGWLRDDLAAWGKRLDGGTPEDRAAVARQMRDWQQAPGLVSVRDAGALSRRPEAERAAWQQLWQDVAALLRRATAQ